MKIIKILWTICFDKKFKAYRQERISTPLEDWCYGGKRIFSEKEKFYNELIVLLTVRFDKQFKLFKHEREITPLEIWHQDGEREFSEMERFYDELIKSGY